MRNKHKHSKHTQYTHAYLILVSSHWRTDRALIDIKWNDANKRDDNQKNMSAR